MATTPITTKVFFDAATFAAEWLYILDKRDRLVKLRYNAAQRDYLDNRTSRDLILKSRQLGFSTLIQAELYRYAVTGTARTATLSHRDDTTQAFRRMAQRFWHHMPESFRPARALANATLTTYADFGSEAYCATAGGVGVGVGQTFSYQHWSEVARWADAQGIISGIMQAGSPRWIVAESTPYGAQGWFYERCMAALDGDDAWRLHFYPWWWGAEYALPLEPGETLDYTDDEAALVAAHNLAPGQIKWRRSKQRELGHLFRQEYPEDPRTCFLLSGEGYFDPLPDAVFTAPTDAAPEPTHVYYAGLDWAQTVDFTALSIMDATANGEVDLLRVNRLPWAEMRARVRDKCARWGVKLLMAEANSMGGTNIEALGEEFRAAGVGTKLMAFTTTADRKLAAASSLRGALHDGGLRLLPDAQARRELRAFQASQSPVTLNWRLEAAEGEHDDTVIARMLANAAWKFAPRWEVL